MTPETRGFWLGVLGTAIFAATLPMTRLAVGAADAPRLSPEFTTLGRAAVAGLLSALTLLLVLRGPWPRRHHWTPLLIGVAGNAVGYPLLLAWGLRTVSSGHAAVITALLPLTTAAVAAVVLHQRARLGFWVCAAGGSVLVVAFSLLRASGPGGGFGVEPADLLLALGMLAASVGYVYGARVTPELGAERTICWVTVLALPLTLPGAWWTWPAQPAAVPAAAWAGFAYLALFSMWIGFFAWYRGLALGGALRVSQAQLLQPFFSILFAVPLLGESLDPVTLGFAAATVAMVGLGRMLSRPRPHGALPAPSATVPARRAAAGRATPR
ncbi:MAG: DMT family transporter [Xylophilus ampelinus]